MLKRLCPALASLILVSSVARAVPFYNGDARTTSRAGTTDDPIAFQVNGTRISGKIFSNTFALRIPFQGSVSASGRFHILVSGSAATGYLAGRVRPGRIIGSGKLRSRMVGPATIRVRALRANLTDGGVPDLSGSMKLTNTTIYLYDHLDLRIWKGDGRYEYKIDFIDFFGDDHVQSNFPFPTRTQLPSVHNDFQRSGLGGLEIQYTFRFFPTDDPYVFKVATDVWKIAFGRADVKTIYETYYKVPQ